LTMFLIITLPMISGHASNFEPFAPRGWGNPLSSSGTGILGAAASIFFAYVGFDAVSTAAEETKNPQRNVPIGLIGSLLICTVFYLLVAGGVVGAYGAQPLIDPATGLAFKEGSPELYASAAGFSIQRGIGFDVLIQLDPFQFLAEFYAQVQLKRGSSNLFKVKVQGVPTDNAIERLRRGIRLEDGVRTAPAEITGIKRTATNSWYEVILHEGRNQQIRRMFDAIGHSVLKLARVRIGPIVEPRLKSGSWRLLTREEVKRVYGKAPAPRGKTKTRRRGLRVSSR